MGKSSFSENKVGSQFFMAQPGKLGTAKQKSITQNLLSRNNEKTPGIAPGALSICPLPGSALLNERLSRREKIKTTA
jgi:hypothetical protein